MRVSIEKLEAEATGFRVDMLVKVVRMMGVLRGIRDHPYLKGRLAMKRRDWRTVSVDDVGFSGRELSAQLLPALRDGPAAGGRAAEAYGERLVADCRSALSAVLPLKDHELAFLELLLDNGEIDPSLLTPDAVLGERIRAQPLLRWRAGHVRRHRRLA